MLIDDSGGYVRPYRPVPPPPPPIQRAPSNTAGPRPSAQVADPNPRLLKAEGITRAQYLQQQAESLRQQAAEAQRKAQEARQLAEQSQQQARIAEQKASKGHSKDDEAAARKLRTQANVDEGNALKCEADANLKAKQATLEESKLKDLQDGRSPSDPSRETRAAQLDVDTAASTVSVLYGPQKGQPDPLAQASDETSRLAKSEDKWTQWQSAAESEIRLAGLRAAGRGEDPQEAMRKQADVIEKRDVNGKVFNYKDEKGKDQEVSGHQWVTEIRDRVAGSSCSENVIYAEHEQALKLWQPVLKEVDQDAVTARQNASPSAVIPPGTPAALRPDYAPDVAKAEELADTKEADAKWWYERSGSVAGDDPYSMGTDYDQRMADANVQRTETDYQVAVAGGDDKAIAKADTQRKRALDEQTLVQDQAAVQASEVELLDAQDQYDQATEDYAEASASQVAPRTVTYKGRYGTESTHTVYPEGYDRAFWAKPGSKMGENVEYDAKEKKYYYVSVTGGRASRTVRDELPEASAKLWEAHDRMKGRAADDKQPGQPGAIKLNNDAKAAYDTSNDLIGTRGANGDEPSLLDPSRWERRSGEIDGNLTQAKADVAAAERSLSISSQYGGPNADLSDAIAHLGEKVQARDYAQAEADALHAVQKWRDSPGDKKLRQEASDAIGKVKNFAGTSPEKIKALRTGRDDAAETLKGLQDRADKDKAQPGDDQKILKLGNEIDYYDALIQKAEAGYQRSGALYLNEKFSFSDSGNKLDTNGETDTRLSRQVDAQGREGGVDAAPPANYEELMAGVQPDKDGVRTLKDGTKILKDGSWRVADQITIFKDADGHVCTTGGNPIAGGVRVSPEVERLWLQLWDADEAVAAAEQPVTQAQEAVDSWNSLHPTDPIKVPGADGKPVATGQDNQVLGADGKPITLLSVDDDPKDLEQRRDDLAQHLDNAAGSSTIAPELLALDRAELEAVGAIIDVQLAGRALLEWQSRQRTEGGQDKAGGELLKQQLRDAETRAVGARDNFLKLRNTQQVTMADVQRDTARSEHEGWQARHPELVGTQAERDSTTWLGVQEAEDAYTQARMVQAGGVVPAAWSAQKDLIEDLAPEDRDDPAKLHELFMANSQVMARPFINQHFLEYGSAPLQMQGRAHLGNELGLALGLPPSRLLDPNTPSANEQLRRSTDLFDGLTGTQKDSYQAVVDQVVGIGGDDAKVTVLPVVYSTRETGVVKTVLFKVEDGKGGAQYVDDRGARYKDLDDFRANNSLPPTDCNIVMPEDDKFTLDHDGNVKLSVTDARTETGFEEWRRENNVDMWIGGISVGLGIVMTVCSGGVLAPVAVGAAALLVGASGYGVATSAMSLSNRSQHGLSVNPFTNREARLDWLNMAGSALAVPTLGAAGRLALLNGQARGMQRLANGHEGLFVRARQAMANRLSGTGGQAARANPADDISFAQLTRTQGSVGDDARALQGKIDVWSDRAQRLGRPTMVAGVAGFEENARYLMDNWSDMSSDQRKQQGGMMLLNLVDFGTPLIVKGAQKGAQALQQFMPPRPPAQRVAADPATQPGRPEPAAGDAVPGLPGVVQVAGRDGGSDTLPSAPGGRPPGQPAGTADRAPVVGAGRPVLAAGGPGAGRISVEPAVPVRAAVTDDAGNTTITSVRADRRRNRSEVQGETVRADAAETGGRAARRRARSIAAGRDSQAAARSSPEGAAAPARSALDDAEVARLQSLSPQAAARLRDRILNDVARALERGANHEQGGTLSVHEIIAAVRAEHALGLRLRASEEMGVDVHGPAFHGGQRWRNVSLKGPFLSHADLMPLPPQAQAKAVESVANRVRTNTAVDVHVVDMFGLSRSAAQDLQQALTAPDVVALLRSRDQRVVFLPHELPANYAQGVAQLQQALVRPAGTRAADASPGDPQGPAPQGRADAAGPRADPAADTLGAGVPPGRMVRVGWRRTMGAVDDAFRARFGEHMDGTMPAARERYQFIFGKRKFFQAAAGGNLTASTAREFAGRFKAITWRSPFDVNNPYAQVYHRIALTQSPRRVVETIAHELAHAYQSVSYDAIGNPGLSHVLAEGGADLVVGMLLGRPRKNANYGAEAGMLKDAINALGPSGNDVFVRAFFKGDADAVQQLHNALTDQYLQLPAGARAPLEGVAAHDPAGPVGRAQAAVPSPLPTAGAAASGSTAFTVNQWATRMMPWLWRGWVDFGADMHVYAAVVPRPGPKDTAVSVTAKDIVAEGRIAQGEQDVAWIRGTRTDDARTVDELLGPPPDGMTYTFIVSDKPLAGSKAGGAVDVPLTSRMENAPGVSPEALSGDVYAPPRYGHFQRRHDWHLPVTRRAGGKPWQLERQPMRTQRDDYDPALNYRAFGAVKLALRHRERTAAAPEEGRFVDKNVAAMVGRAAVPMQDSASGLAVADIHNHPNTFPFQFYLRQVTFIKRLLEGAGRTGLINDRLGTGGTGLKITLSYEMIVYITRALNGSWQGYTHLDLPSVYSRYSQRSDWKILHEYEQLPKALNEAKLSEDLADVIIPSITGIPTYPGSGVRPIEELAHMALFFPRVDPMGGEINGPKGVKSYLDGRTFGQKPSESLGRTGTEVNDALEANVAAFGEAGLVTVVHADSGVMERSALDGLPVAAPSGLQHIFKTLNMVMRNGPYDLSHIPRNDASFMMDSAQIRKILAQGQTRDVGPVVLAHAGGASDRVLAAEHQAEIVLWAAEHPLLPHVYFDSSWLPTIQTLFHNPKHRDAIMRLMASGKLLYGGDVTNFQSFEQFAAPWYQQQDMVRHLDTHDPDALRVYAGDGFRNLYKESQERWAWFRYRCAKDPQYAEYVAALPGDRRQQLDEFVADYEARHPGVDWLGQRPNRLIAAAATGIPRPQVSGLGGSATEPLWAAIHQQVAHRRVLDGTSLPDALGLARTDGLILPTGAQAPRPSPQARQATAPAKDTTISNYMLRNKPFTREQLERLKDADGNHYTKEAMDAAEAAANTGAPRAFQLLTLLSTEYVTQRQQVVNKHLDAAEKSRFRKTVAALGVVGVTMVGGGAAASHAGMVGDWLAAGALAERGLQGGARAGVQQLRRKIYESFQEESNGTQGMLDYVADQLARSGSKIGLAADRISGRDGLAEQFAQAKTDLDYMLSQPINTRGGETADMRRAFLGSELTGLVVKGDRALGVAAAGIEPTNFRTPLGRGISALTAAAYEVGAISCLQALEAHPSPVQAGALALLFAGNAGLGAYHMVGAVSSYFGRNLAEQPLMRRLAGLGAYPALALGNLGLASGSVAKGLAATSGAERVLHFSAAFAEGVLSAASGYLGRSAFRAEFGLPPLAFIKHKLGIETQDNRWLDYGHVDLPRRVPQAVLWASGGLIGLALVQAAQALLEGGADDDDCRPPPGHTPTPTPSLSPSVAPTAPPSTTATPPLMPSTPSVSATPGTSPGSVSPTPSGTSCGMPLPSGTQSPTGKPKPTGSSTSAPASTPARPSPTLIRVPHGYIPVAFQQPLDPDAAGRSLGGGATESTAAAQPQSGAAGSRALSQFLQLDGAGRRDFRAALAGIAPPGDDADAVDV
jgi:hypothetical protein